MRTRLLLSLFFFAFCVRLSATLPEAPNTKNINKEFLIAKAPSRKAQKKSKQKRPKENVPDIETVGHDFQKFGEEVAHRIGKVVDKRGFLMFGDPWTIQGIPLIFPSPATGLNLGLHAKLTDIRREDPHALQIEAQVMTSDKGRYKDFFNLDYPYILGGLYRFTGGISYNRDITFPYFGIGNDTVIEKNGLKEDSAYYQTTRENPAIDLRLLRYLGNHWLLGPIAGAHWMSVNSPPGSLLDTEKPVGWTGGRTPYLGFALVHDTLDFEPYPSRGTYHEFYFAWSNHLWGSTFDYLRLTYTYRRYIPLHPRLTLAYRALVEDLVGNAPFYELDAVGGSDSTLGFGGDRFMRGYQSNRFIDHIKTVLGFELRWDPVHFYFAEQSLELGFVPFVDTGRVWNQLLPFRWDTIHASVGWGTRIIWDKRLILRGDFALTPEGTSFYVELGSSF